MTRMKFVGRGHINSPRSGVGKFAGGTHFRLCRPVTRRDKIRPEFEPVNKTELYVFSVFVEIFGLWWSVRPRV